MPITPSVRERLWQIISLLVFIESATSIKLLELDVPKSVALKSRAALSCRWQLGPTDVLYSVKWYKDGKEFFRHVPRDVEPQRKFPLPGVDVKESDTSGSSLVLSPATLDTGGRYRCEVSGERPLFATVSDHADMAVVVLPEHGPIITGFHFKYRIGDRIEAYCTSGHSQPATQLFWYINGEPIPTEEYTSTYRSENALIVTSLILDFEIKEMHFKKNVLKVKCLATITPVYWKSNEESAVQEKSRLQHDIGTMSITSRATRADRVQANSSTMNILANSCIFFVIIFAQYIGN